MSKFFMASGSHAKAWEFLELRQGAIVGKIMGFLLQDMDSMVKTTMAI